MKLKVMLVLVLSQTAAAAFAQSDPAASAKVRLGPLALSPTLSLTNAGVDTNVFNEATSQAPTQDFTLTVTPAAVLWLHVGPALLTGTIKEDIVWYETYASERGLNNLSKLDATLPLNRLILNGSVSYLTTRERPGYEIDTRARRHEVGYDGSVEVRGFSTTFIGVHAQRQTVRFADGTVFRGVSLPDQLNRESTTGGVTVRYQATTLTGFTFELSRLQDQFDSRPLGGSKSTEATITVKFDPAALLKGAAMFGFRDFAPDDLDVPGYKGSIAKVGLSYVAAGSTRLAVEAVRDVQYSFNLTQPYYLQTGITVSIAQQIFGPVDVIGRAGLQHLAYQNRGGVVALEPDRADVVHSYGLGVGYHLGEDLRFGFNADHDHRESQVSFRTYEGWRFGTAITYGL